MRRQECCGYCENCTTIGLCLARLGSICFSKRTTVHGETRCKKSWDRFEEYDSLSLRYVKQVSGKRKDLRLEKYKSKILISEVPTLLNLRTGAMKRLKDNSDAPEARHRTLPKTDTSKEKDKATFYSPAEEWVLPAASTKEPEEREFVVDSGASMHMVSKRDLNSAELETMRTSRSPTVMTANGEVQTKEHATVCQSIGLIRDVLSLGKLCEDHGCSYHWTSGQKTTSHQKWQEDWLQKNKLCAIRSPWLIEEILYNAHNLLLHHLHVRILYSTATDTPKILYPKEVEVRVRSHGETRRINQQKTGNTNKIEGPEEIQSDLSHNLPDWLQEFREKLVDESSPSEPLGNPTPKDQDTFPVLVINYQWSREQKWTPVRVSILSTRTFRRTQIAIPAWRQK